MNISNYEDVLVLDTNIILNDHENIEYDYR